MTGMACLSLYGERWRTGGTEEPSMNGTMDDRTQGRDERLTTTQQQIRDRNARLPAHVKRSIDRYRVSLGMIPLWGSSVERRRRA
jgi:hypothetical protein